jgi:ankyrin repeat protein
MPGSIRSLKTASALHVASRGRATGEIEAGRALLAAGADPNATDSSRNGPLWTAVFDNNGGRFIELLLEAGADPLQVTRAGRTPVSLARTIGGGTADRFDTYPRGAPHLGAHR